MRVLVRTTLCSLLLAPLPSAVGLQAQPAQDLLNRSTTYGVKVGLVSPGCVYVDDSDCFDSDVSYSIAGFVDTRLGERLLGGLNLEVNDAQAANVDFNEILLELDLNLKADLMNPTSEVGFRPGLGVGYGLSDVGDETLNAITLKALLEVLFPTMSGITWMGEAVLYGSPTAWTESSDVTWGPGFLLRAGVLF